MQLGGIALDNLDIRPAPTQARSENGIELDRNDPTRNPGELGRQSARARTEINGKVVRTDAGVKDEFGR